MFKLLFLAAGLGIISGIIRGIYILVKAYVIQLYEKFNKKY